MEIFSSQLYWSKQKLHNVNTKKEVKVPENVAININNQSINQSIKAFTITKGL